MVTKIVRIVVAVFLASGVFLVSQKIALAGAAIEAPTVAEHLDKGKYSSAEIKSYLKGLKGKEIVANGKIEDIKSGRSGNKVVVLVNVPGRDKPFVVDVVVKGESNLHKNEHVSCNGKYKNYNMFTLNGITLTDGKCSK
jgi:hypothetical protein